MIEFNVDQISTLSITSQKYPDIMKIYNYERIHKLFKAGLTAKSFTAIENLL